MNVLRSLWVAARQLRHVACNPPRLILSEQLITLVVDVGECLAAMVAQQLRALDAFRLRLSWPHRHRDGHQLAVGFIVRRLVAEIDIGNARLPPDIVNVRHGEAAGVIWPHGVMLAVQRIV
jgi:hypothetical protein